jgi:MoxR-like ATPase
VSVPLVPAAARIPAQGLLGREGKPYHAHPDLLAAANVALLLRRPLLLTGEPGCGKTDFAFALAHALTGPDSLRECHVRSDSQAKDLLYHYDALRRFGDAQHGDDPAKARARDPRGYLELLPLGGALAGTGEPVVLIDEIDKAPRDLPNDLLRELDHGRFTLPEVPADAPPHPSGLVREMGRSRNDPSRPVVVITSNVERQLPDPFLRRCVFFHIPYPTEAELLRILADRFPGEEPLLRRAVQAFAAMRSVHTLTKKPGTAELVDWAMALVLAYDRYAAHKALGDFLETGAADAAARPWSRLPGLSCLVKLREDRQKLGLSVG